MALQIVTLPLGLLQANCYLLADDESGLAAAVDPGDEAPRVLAALEERRWQLKHILITHAHFDHMGAVAELAETAGADVALHPDDLPLWRGGGGARLFGFSFQPGSEPGVLLQAGQQLTVGAVTLEVLFVPGHSPGHVAFYVPAAAAVFTGDTLFQDGVGRTDLLGGDYATLMRSLRDVLCVLPDATAVYPGHGPVTTIGDEKRFNPFLAR